MDRFAEGPQSSRSTSFEERLAARDLRTAALKARTRETGLRGQPAIASRSGEAGGDESAEDNPLARR
jgi:hypothetical protein